MSKYFIFYELTTTAELKAAAGTQPERVHSLAVHGPCCHEAHCLVCACCGAIPKRSEFDKTNTGDIKWANVSPASNGKPNSHQHSTGRNAENPFSGVSCAKKYSYIYLSTFVGQFCLCHHSNFINSLLWCWCDKQYPWPHKKTTGIRTEEAVCCYWQQRPTHHKIISNTKDKQRCTENVPFVHYWFYLRSQKKHIHKKSHRMHNTKNFDMNTHCII